MINEIPIDEITTYAGYFQDPQAEMALASIIEGNTRAQFWLAPQPESDVVLLWDKGNNVFYLSGSRAPEGITDGLALFIKTEIKEKALAERRPYFRVRALSPVCEAIVAGLFQGFMLGPTDKRFYVFRGSQVKAVLAPALANLRFEMIDTAFLDQAGLLNLQGVKGEIKQMWPSLERFCGWGFGFAALLEQTIICWCTAEYMSRNRCGIGIQTVAEFEGRGVATATAARFVDVCLRRNIIPHWECDGQNIGSVRVAEKVGFELVQETIFWVGMFT